MPVPKCGGRAQGVDGVVDAGAVRPPVAAGEPARPEQVRDLQTAFGQQLGRLLLAAVGELLPPGAEAGIPAAA